jgi:Protein of unknown function (DUF742)
MSDPDATWQHGGPERLYVITGGRAGSPEEKPDRTALGLVTLIVAKAGPVTGMQPEHVAILRLCAAPLSVAELTAYLQLPFSVVTVLLGDLLAAGRVEARSAVPPVADMRLLEEVIHGLEQL